MTKSETRFLKSQLKSFFDATGVQPPVTRKKIEKAGYEVSDFLLMLAEKLKSWSKEPLIRNYLSACEKLL